MNHNLEPGKKHIMASSEARIAASKRNGALSKGPVSDRGKSISKRNSLKHGLTGAGVVMVEGDAAEVERRTGVYAQETDATGEIGMALSRQLALSAVRLERAADQQNAALSIHVLQVEVDFVPPEGVDEAEAAQLRTEAVRAAMFDPSKEATLARKYEAAAQRLFFRCLKEIERIRKQNEVAAMKAFADPVGSFSTEDKEDDVEEMTDAEFDAYCAKMGVPPVSIEEIPPHLAHYFSKEYIPITDPRRR